MGIRDYQTALRILRTDTTECVVIAMAKFLSAAWGLRRAKMIDVSLPIPV